MRTSQTYRKSWTLESKKLTEHITISIQKDLPQNSQKFMTKREFSRHPGRRRLCHIKKTPLQRENQDGGVGKHTAPPRTTRTDRKLNGKEVRHQGNKK